jgi:hypothetical protein
VRETPRLDTRTLIRMAASDPPPSMAPVFAVPSAEGATLALGELLREGKPAVTTTPRCAVAIDVFTHDDVLLQRALAHADVPANVRDAFRELIDRHVSRFAEAQRIDAHAATGGARTRGEPYRGGGAPLPSNDFAGFPCGHAMAAANERITKLRARLREAAELDVRLYAVPFLVASIERRREKQQAVVMRRGDGMYVYGLAVEG